jgi:hypothetical protein
MASGLRRNVDDTDQGQVTVVLGELGRTSQRPAKRAQIRRRQE